MANYLAIRDDIKAKLNAVAGIGIVHGYERWIVDSKKFLDAFTSGGKVIGCEITRKRVTEHQRGAFFGHNVMVVHLYMGLDDAAATGEPFQVLVDAVRAKFRAADPPAGSPWDYRNGDDDSASPVQVPLIDERMFGSVLFHHAEIHISVTERSL